MVLDDPVVRWLRVRAAQNDKSVSRYVGDLLKGEMSEEERYHQAMERYLSRQPARISEPGSYPRRDQLHDRADLRR